jgi:hypothetical protein
LTIHGGKGDAALGIQPEKVQYVKCVGAQTLMVLYADPSFAADGRGCNIFPGWSRAEALKIIHGAAVKHGWDMESKNNRYYWKNQVWWPEMVRFIMNCTIRDDDIHKWSKFDQCDAGLDAFNERVKRWKDPVPIVKKYLVDYLAVERLV